MAHINIFIYAGEWKTIGSVPSQVSRVFDKRTTLERTINGKKSNSYTTNPMLEKTIKTKNLLSDCNEITLHWQTNKWIALNLELLVFYVKRLNLQSKEKNWNFPVQILSSSVVVDGSRIMSSHRWPLKVQCNLNLREIKLICFCLKISERRKKNWQSYLMFPYLVRIVRRRSCFFYSNNNSIAKLHFCTHEKKWVSLLHAKALVLICPSRTHKIGLRSSFWSDLTKTTYLKLCTMTTNKWTKRKANISIHVCATWKVMCDETFGIQSISKFHLIWWREKAQIHSIKLETN